MDGGSNCRVVGSKGILELVHVGRFDSQHHKSRTSSPIQSHPFEHLLRNSSDPKPFRYRLKKSQHSERNVATSLHDEQRRPLRNLRVLLLSPLHRLATTIHRRPHRLYYRNYPFRPLRSFDRIPETATRRPEELFQKSRRTLPRSTVWLLALLWQGVDFILAITKNRHTFPCRTKLFTRPRLLQNLPLPPHLSFSQTQSFQKANTRSTFTPYIPIFTTQQCLQPISSTELDTRPRYFTSSSWIYPS